MKNLAFKTLISPRKNVAPDIKAMFSLPNQ